MEDWNGNNNQMHNRTWNDVLILVKRIRPIVYPSPLSVTILTSLSNPLTSRRINISCSHYNNVRNKLLAECLGQKKQQHPIVPIHYRRSKVRSLPIFTFLCKPQKDSAEWLFVKLVCELTLGLITDSYRGNNPLIILQKQVSSVSFCHLKALFQQIGLWTFLWKIGACFFCQKCCRIYEQTIK